MTRKRRPLIRGNQIPPDKVGTVLIEMAQTIKSSAFMRITDLIGEGEIVGLVDGFKSVYLNETPVQASDGSTNFSQVQVATRTGTQAQTYMYDAPQSEAEFSVGVEVLKATPVVRSITNTNVNRARVKLVFPELITQDQDTGEVNGAFCEIQIWVQPHGGSYALTNTRDFAGKSTSRFELEFAVPLAGDGPWAIRVVRVSDDPPDQYTRNAFYWESYVEVIDAKLRYPNSALVSIRLDAETFSSVPTRYYDMKLLKIQIPSNYNPATRVYTGSWDGTFQVAWSDNPAWVFFDLLTDSRYGLGAFIDASQVDKWTLYEVARYCDELVPNGDGGWEPRFTCNMLIKDRADAYSVLQNLASMFRGMIYWSAGSVTVSQDSPQDASYLYTAANVVEGRFTYQGASLKTRHTVAVVTWNDPEDFCRPKVEYVEDQAAIALYGIQTIQITAVGCTSRGQANRLGRWLLYTEQHESETVSFKAGLDAMVARPGQVIKVSDPSRAGARFGGRVVSATVSHVEIDQDISGSVSGDSLLVLLPSGEIETRTVIGSSGRTIQVQPDFSDAPQALAVWMLQSNAVAPSTWRVISVKEEDGGQYTVTALSHDPDKFAEIESGLVLKARSYSILKAAPAAPQNLTLTESLYRIGAEVKVKLTVSWDKVDRASSYLVVYTKDNENPVKIEVPVNETEILDVSPGTFSVRVSASNSLGKTSVATTGSKEVFGKTLPPTSVQNFSMIPSAGLAYLTWTQATDLDVLVGGQVRIRHTPLTTGQFWRNAVDIIPAVPGNATSAFAPLLAGTYMAKFVDSSGNYSADEVLIVTTVPSALPINIVSTQTESPAFAGVRSDMTIDTTTGYLVLDSDELVDDYGAVDSVGNWDFPGGIVSSGTYTFENTVDFGAVWPFSISSTIDLQAVDLGNVIDNRVALMDTWPDIDGEFVDDVNAQLYLRTTNDDPAGSPTWSDWKPVRTGNYDARGVQLQLRCTSGYEMHTLYIKSLEAVIDMYDRTENQGPLASGTGASYRVNYQFPFWESPAVGITAEDMQTGDFYSITSSSASGFNIVFKNAAGTIVSRNFYAIAKGYGRQVA